MLMQGREAGPATSRAAAAIHLPPDKLELGDMALGPAVGPGLGQRRVDCGLIKRDVSAEGGEHAALASEIHAGNAPGVLDRGMRWKRSTRSRAVTNAGTAASTVATITASARASRSRSASMIRAIILAGGIRPVAPPSGCSLRRRRVAHWVTIRERPPKPDDLPAAGQQIGQVLPGLVRQRARLRGRWWQGMVRRSGRLSAGCAVPGTGGAEVTRPVSGEVG
jgi:hypothetical protein